MRGLRAMFNREQRSYEALVSGHLDGALDAGGRERLDALLAASPTRAGEVRELEAVTRLLRAQAPVEAPRSFALPYAPAPAVRPASGGVLRWAQAATVAASLALVALIGADISGLGGGSPVNGAGPVIESLKTAAAGDAAGTEFALAAPTPEAEGMAITSLVPEVSAGDGAGEAPTVEPAPAGRGPLEWAQLAAGLATALLALGTVALTTTLRRLR